MSLKKIQSIIRIFLRLLYYISQHIFHISSIITECSRVWLIFTEMLWNRSRYREMSLHRVVPSAHVIGTFPCRMKWAERKTTSFSLERIQGWIDTCNHIQHGNSLPTPKNSTGLAMGIVMMLDPLNMRKRYTFC